MTIQFSSNWCPSLNSPKQLYVDLVLYANKPAYFEWTENVGSGYGQYTIHTNPNSCPAYVYTMAEVHNASLKQYTVCMRRVDPSNTDLRPEILTLSRGQLTDGMSASFDTAEAAARFIYLNSVGFYGVIIPRSGCVMLRGPRFIGDYQSCYYDAKLNAWKRDQEDGGCVCNQDPINFIQIEGIPDIYEKNFRYIAELIEALQVLQLPSGAVQQKVNGICTYNTLVFDCPNAPWLSNPIHWTA